MASKLNEPIQKTHAKEAYILLLFKLRDHLAPAVKMEKLSCTISVTPSRFARTELSGTPACSPMVRSTASSATAKTGLPTARGKTVHYSLAETRSRTKRHVVLGVQSRGQRSVKSLYSQLT